MDQDESFRIKGKGPCIAERTETQESFGVPYRNKILTTRANLMKKFLWKELLDEYNRQNLVVPDLGPNHTEYFENFCKDKPPEDEERLELRINKYPLYCTTPITLWNHEGDPTKTFRVKYSITRPLQECTEKFGQ
ncbi:uncharacterized protein LOC6579476 [Drosophila mojavensis]|uniref:Uncharacterized protein n=1 Tax=Drosophila mojavensis TaxID=7230 RepID=B4KQV7_DROMO|nr:uncharacterized protein LOC6579476 [Drosophila mojavensis]EDW09306.1 uncharacterized protein Dmoj_GI20442 [Drosophila mojavensis]